MKKILVAILIVASGMMTANASSAAEEQTEATPPMAALPAEIERPTIVLFWATWCPYCKNLMPHLQSILDEFGTENIEVWALSIREESDADPVAYLEKRGYQFRAFAKAEAYAEDWQVRATPGVFLLDADGKVRWHLGMAHAMQNRMEGVDVHWQRATRLAPFWAAELRRAIRAK